MPQPGQRRQRARKQLAEDAGGRGEERGVVAFQQERQHRRIGAARRDQRRGPGGPGVEQAGAEGEGPVEGTGVAEPVAGAQIVPARHHHLPRPDRAMRVHHRARHAGGAGGKDDIGRAVGGPQGEIRWRQGGHFVQCGGGQQRHVGLGAGHCRVTQDERRREDVDDSRGLGVGELGRGRHRDQPGGNAAEEGQREIRGIAQPHQHPVARGQPALQEPGGDTAHRTLEPGIAPAFGP